MRIRTPLSLLAGLAVIAGALTPGVPAAATAPAPAPGGYKPAPIAWKSCGTKLPPGFECGRVQVPLDWNDVGGTKISLAVSRLAHRGKSQYRGVMLVNPGGPGGSGLTLPYIRNFVPNHRGNSYDWIGFDPRGVGSSTPSISCDPSELAPPKLPYTPSTLKIEHAWIRKAKAYAAACEAKYPALLKHMTTIDAAKDMDAIRFALGVDRINYYGFSYGTYLGQVYATLFPDHLRRVVFDGTVDPRRIWYGANLDQDTAFEVAINTFFAWVAKYDSTYHLGSTAATVSRRFYAVQSALERHPVGVIGSSEWNDLILPAAYVQVVWPGLAAAFSAYAVNGDTKALRKAYSDYADEDENEFAVYSAVQCTDASWPRSFAEYGPTQFELAKTSPFLTWSNAWFNASCLYWKAPSGTPLEIDGSKVKSVLMINETLDAATPYAGSIEVRKRFPGARLIAEPGGTSHANSLSGNACVDDRIAAYLANGALPDRKAGDEADVLCAPLPQPKPKRPGASGSSSGSSRLFGTLLGFR